MNKEAISKTQAFMIKYEPGRRPDQPMSEFLLIWRVEADDTYRNHIRHVGQIAEPVLFFTWEGHGVCKLFDNGHEREYHLKAHTLLFLDKHTRLQYHGCEGCHWKFFYIRFTNL